jgi:hypothetical protein
MNHGEASGLAWHGYAIMASASAKTAFSFFIHCNPFVAMSSSYPFFNLYQRLLTCRNYRVFS